MFSFPLIPYTPTNTIKNQLQKSKINHKINKKKINHKINKKNQPLEQNRWIGGVDGNR